MTAARRLRVVVLGYLVRGPLAGYAWHPLHYVHSLARCGHEVHYLEDSDDYPSCYDPARDVTDSEPAYGLRFATELFDGLGLGSRWAYYDAHTATWHGGAARSVQEVCSRADVVINVSGVNPLRHGLERVPARILIDTDPVFAQLRHRRDPEARERALRHNAFFSFAWNTGALPDDGIRWRATRQPIALDLWRARPPAPAGAPWTTVMQWESYPPENDGERVYGMKAQTFPRYIELPRELPVTFELAIGGAGAPRELLAEKGWELRDSREPTIDPWRYQDYIAGSRGEFSVAKHGYVASASGWFSERTCAYLASGRPAVVQDTGFSHWLPVGEGLLAFSTPEQAREAILAVERDYERHCRAARELAERHFDGLVVVRELLAGAGC